jgi:protein-tyrosine phosphatase
VHSLEAGNKTWKCGVLEHVRAELRQALAVIAGASAGPLLFHCVAGKDRTGLLAALLLALAGATPAAIAGDYAQSSENLRAGYLARYADKEPARIIEALRCPEIGAYNMLSFLEHSGGVRVYLSELGLTAAQIDALRARLRG